MSESLPWSNPDHDVLGDLRRFRNEATRPLSHFTPVLTPEEEDFLRRYQQALDDLGERWADPVGSGSVRIVPDPPVTTVPATLEEALDKLAEVQRQLEEMRRTASGYYNKLSALETQCTRLRRSRDSLRELLATFSDVEPGWERSSLVAALDMAAYRADAEG